MMLVAKTVEEVAGFMKGIEWQTPRPYYGGDKIAGVTGGDAREVPRPA